jgi:hypothetical protein
MLTEPHEDCPQRSLRRFWPETFCSTDRKFDRQAENQPYIEWLQPQQLTDDIGPQDGSGEEEDEGDNDDADDLSNDEDEESKVDEQRDEDGQEEVNSQGEEDESKEVDWDGKKIAEICKGRSIVRAFMEGMIDDENLLPYCDQVEVVASFAEQSTSHNIEKPVALLDDRTYDGTIPGKQDNCRRYLGPLTSRQLRVELGKQVALIARLQCILETDILHSVFTSSQIKMTCPRGVKVGAVTPIGE